MKRTQRKLDSNQAKRFPRPPLKGSDVVRPLRTPEALADEAKAQNAGHIIAYAPHVRDGQFYFYSVDSTERATLCISRWAKKEPWRIHQLKGRDWLPVQPETARAVDTWYSESRFARPIRWNGSSKVIRM